MKTTTIADISRFLHSIAPPQLAESYDNVGLLVGESLKPVHTILFCLEITKEVVLEAKQLGCELIVAHHPIWFGKRTRITDEDYVGRILLQAIQSGIGLFAIHTNLDNIMEGVNAKIAERIGLHNLRFLSPKPGNSNSKPAGSGMIGTLNAPVPVEAFLAHLCHQFHTPVIRYSPFAKEKLIHSVAICGGAGAFLIPDALKAHADAFVTGDVTHHRFFEADNEMLIADLGHFESEQFTPEILNEWVQHQFTELKCIVSQVSTNPVRYFIHGQS